MTIDIEKIRADTPGIGTVAHFNNAGASLMPTPVLDAQIDHLKLEASIGGYEAAAAAAAACGDCCAYIGEEAAAQLQPAASAAGWW